MCTRLVIRITSDQWALEMCCPADQAECHPRVRLCREGAGAVGHSTACKKGSWVSRHLPAGSEGGKDKAAKQSLSLLFLSYLGKNKAAFSQKARLLLQMKAVGKFAISLVPSSRLTLASLVTLQQFLIF